MFAKKDNSRYKSGYVDKSPDELPGVKKKNHLFSHLQVEKYGLNIWTGYINIPSLLLKSCAGILRYSVARPPRGISHLSSTKRSSRKN